jgi:hypothetical protein
MRTFKTQLAKSYAVFDKGFRKLDGRDPQSPIIDFVRRKSDVGRRRALDKIRATLGAGVVLEGVRLDGKYPIAVWSILKPRDAVAYGNESGEPTASGRAQNCVTVHYVIAGVIGGHLGIADGLWTIEVPDHAIGRAIERSGGMAPEPIIREAHHNLLALDIASIVDENNCADAKSFIVKAGSGGFICKLTSGADRSLGGEMEVHARAET